MTVEETLPLRATYNGPEGSQDFEHKTEILDPGSVASKQKYLSELRKSTKRLQDEINTFLTRKMEEDKVKAQGVTQQSINNKSRDEEEEENYGEEKVEDD